MGSGVSVDVGSLPQTMDEHQCREIAGESFDEGLFYSVESGGTVTRQVFAEAVSRRKDCFLSHDWATDNNHARVGIINRALQKRGLTTWFDEEQMQGNIKKQMVSGINNSQCVIVFVTKKYTEKVSGNNAEDNCQLEFNYAARTKTANHMIPVVMEKGMGITRTWKGEVGLVLGGQMYVDLHGDLNDEAYLNKKVDELHDAIMAVIHHKAKDFHLKDTPSPIPSSKDMSSPSSQSAATNATTAITVLNGEDGAATKEAISAPWAFWSDTGGMAQIHQLHDGTIAAVCTDGRIATKETISAGWEFWTDTSGVAQIHQLHDGSIVAVSTVGTVFDRKTTSAPWACWSDSGGIAQIHQLHDGTIAAVCSDGRIATKETISARWEFWTDTAGVAQIHQLHDGSIVAVSIVGTVFDRKTTSAPWACWSDTGGIAQIHQLHDGTIAAVCSDGRIATKETISAGWEFRTDTSGIAQIRQLHDGSIVSVSTSGLVAAKHPQQTADP